MLLKSAEQSRSTISNDDEMLHKILYLYMFPSSMLADLGKFAINFLFFPHLKADLGRNINVLLFARPAFP